MTNTREIIYKIGRKELVRSLGVREQAVSNAINAGIFPASWYKTIASLSKNKGFEVPEALFNFRGE